MSGPVDVLAVMDREIEALRNTKAMVVFSMSADRQAAYAEQLESLIATRAAVAELIDAAVGFRAITSGDEAGSKGWEAASRLDAALARAGGAA